MIRNIDIVRAKGVFVKGNWFNRNVLMLNETVQGAANQSKRDENSPGKSRYDEG